MIVCHCHGISDRRIESEVKLGATTVGEIGERCGAGTNCGGCVPLIEHILESRLVALIDGPATIENPTTIEKRHAVSRVTLGS